MARKPPFKRRPPAPPPAPDAEAPPSASPAPRGSDRSAVRAGELRRDGLRAYVPASMPEAVDTAPGDVPVSTSLSELEAFASMGAVDMDALLQGIAAPPPRVEPGQKVRGTVRRVTADDVYVDLGARSEGWIARRELTQVAVGDTVDAFVVAVDEGGVTLSVRLSGDAAVDMLDDALDSGVPVEGKVESRSSGGYTVRVGSVRAFCPISQISRIPLADPDSVLGQTLAFLVLETGDKVVVSRRQLEERDVEGLREATLARLLPGVVVDAVVSGVQPWGAFLDVDGVELFLSRREASWGDVDDLTTRFERGQRVRARVLDTAAEGGRITVSVKDPDLDPWNTATQLFPPGKVATGAVVSQTEFGVFVELAPGLQGLVHRSRMAKLPPVGASIEIRVLGVDPDRRRLELAPSDFDPEAQAANAVGAEVTGEVVEVTEQGIGVHLADGRRAWLPAREVELTPGTVLAQHFRVGHPVTARIVSEDPKRGRVTLSTRPADEGGSWRDALAKQSGAAGMGTLGDLFKARRS
ncbi:MAG: S1 RNA-binding domain-containing protein [Alphaproteobacteria bacterium]|nr:S1 RNA-binding domain-containing protein [Alphaproteobacteria bacterium]